MNVIYYFCTHQQHPSRDPLDLLQSLATQLIVINPELAPFIVETYTNKGLRPSKKKLGVILEKLITSMDFLRVVVDGLDECSPDEYKEILEDLLRIRGLTPGACKVLISSRREPSITKILHSKPTIRLEDHTEHINDMISSFVNSQLKMLPHELTSEKIDMFRAQIVSKANGKPM